MKFLINKSNNTTAGSNPPFKGGGGISYILNQKFKIEK